MSLSLADVLTEFGGSEVSAMELYSDMFRLGSGLIQRSDERPSDTTESKANPIVLGAFGGHDDGSGHIAGGRMRRRILFEDTFEETLSEFQSADWAITNGLTYWGRANTGENQSQMLAMVFDLDGTTPATLRNFLGSAYNSDYLYYPVPQYIVMSGHNVHLYYVFEEPIDLYPSIKVQLKALKYALTDRMWNQYTSTEEKVQHQGINQGFRVVGGKTKKGGVVRAFRMDSHPVTVGELCEYVPSDAMVDLEERFHPSRHTLAEAAKLYPAWYQKVIVEGRPADGTWAAKEDLYKWWLRQARESVAHGHRYFCLMALAIFAAKCGITDEARVRADMESLVPFYRGFDTEKDAAPFGEGGEVDAAMECFDARYCRFPRKDIQKITGVPMPPNKRNGLQQKQHLYLARRRKEDMKAIGVPMKGAEGRPKGSGTKREVVRAYAESHPGESQRAIAKALGVSPTTVNKWLKDV